MIKHVTITVTGTVHGVGFRWCAIDKALELGVNGIVRNQGDNQVYIEVEGEIDQLQKFLKWCHVGPEGAKIDNVDFQSTEELKGFTEFAAEM